MTPPNSIRWNNTETEADIKLALQAGFRSIDTAWDYGDQVWVCRTKTRWRWIRVGDSVKTSFVS